MKKHYVETFLGSEGETTAVYVGLREEVDPCVKKSTRALSVPSWFDSERAALAYCEEVKKAGCKRYWLVQEFHYSDDRQDKAKIVVNMYDDTYPASYDGQTINDKNGKTYITQVRTMWFCDYDVARRYVDGFNLCVQRLAPVRKAS